MVPRIPPNHYNTIDFTSLALQYPGFARKLKPNGQLDFSDPESVRQLTICLLDRDFDLTVTLPPDRLCPPVPNRFNYILFLQRLLDSTSPSFRDSHDPTRGIVGIDIGTGASAIYPLLGTRQFANWIFLATEIDEASRASAAENISRNGLRDRIKLLDNENSNGKASSSSLLIPTKALPVFPGAADRIDFLMTNPPFYASTAEMAASAKLKARPPNSSCTGSAGEMVYQYRGDFPATTTPMLNQALATGGEIAFTAQLLHESTSPSLRHRIQWFSAMLGKLSSLAPLIALIHQFHARLHHHDDYVTTTTTTTRSSSGANYAVSEFIQGQKTRRWCLAWSWMPLRPPVSLARGIPGLEKRLLPLVSEFEFAFAAQSVAAVSAALDQVMQQLAADANHQNHDHGHDNDDDDDDDDDDNDDDDNDDDDEVVVRWQWKSKVSMGLASVRRDCWSRKARRQRNKRMHRTGEDGGGGMNRDVDMKDNTNNGNHDDGDYDNDDDDDDDDDDDKPALVVKISTRHEMTNNTKAETVVKTRWMQGIDGVLFESFCGWLKRKVESNVQT